MGSVDHYEIISDLPVNGTDDCEAHPKYWIAALVQMNCEKRVEVKLNKLGFETYLPVQREEHQWSDRKKTIERRVIPMIVFVRIDRKDAEYVRNLSFVHKLITYPGSKDVATPIPDEQINNLKFLLSNAESEVSIVSNMKIGDKVRIIRGTLKGLIGTLFMMNGKTPKVAIRINGLGYASVSISISSIKKIV